MTRNKNTANPDILLSSLSDDVKPRSWLGTEGSPQREDPQQRLRWQAHLEFTHNHTVGDLTWELIDPVLPRSERLRSLVLGGIPHSMRPQVSSYTPAPLLNLTAKFDLVEYFIFHSSDMSRSLDFVD